MRTGNCDGHLHGKRRRFAGSFGRRERYNLPNRFIHIDGRRSERFERDDCVDGKRRGFDHGRREHADADIYGSSR